GSAICTEREGHRKTARKLKAVFAQRRCTAVRRPRQCLAPCTTQVIAWVAICQPLIAGSPEPCGRIRRTRRSPPTCKCCGARCQRKSGNSLPRTPNNRGKEERDASFM